MKKQISLGKFLREARRTAGLTQVELAEKLECTPTYISHLKNDDTKEPSLKLLKGIARATGVNICVVVTVSGKIKAL